MSHGLPSYAGVVFSSEKSEKSISGLGIGPTFNLLFNLLFSLKVKNTNCLPEVFSGHLLILNTVTYFHLSKEKYK